MNRVNKWTEHLVDGLFPQACLFCGLASHRALPLCRDCEGELPRNAPSCRRCALPLPTGSQACECGHCLAAPPPFDRTLAPYVYDEQLALLIHRWKYRPEPHLGRLAAALWQRGQPAAIPPVDLLLPVPMHWGKLLRRGFNQAEQFCHLLHRTHPELRSLPMARRLLRRSRGAAVQAGLDARARRANLRGAFTLQDRCDNLRVAVVDDVMTTGATASELARCLKSGGAREVHLWCLARTPTPSDH